MDNRWDNSSEVSSGTDPSLISVSDVLPVSKLKEKN